MCIRDRSCLLRAFAVEDIFSGLHRLIFVCGTDAALDEARLYCALQMLGQKPARRERQLEHVTVL